MRSRVSFALAIRRCVQHADIVVRGGLVVTMDQHRTVLSDGAIAVRDGAIVAVGPRDVVGAGHHATRVIDAADRLIVPGLIDAHTHMPMTLFRGLADDVPLHTWFERHVWPAERQFIHPETVRWGSRLGVAELLRSGVTTVCDMYFFEVGKRADLAIIDLDEDNLVPLYDPLSHLAYAVESSDVRTVLVDGRVVLEDGRLTTADEREIRRRVRTLATEIGSMRPDVS
jgi:cytosine/adenosine deaminase-related metal-dependent hydrolase